MNSKPSIGLGSPLAQAAWQPDEREIRVERLRFLYGQTFGHVAIGFLLAVVVTGGYYMETGRPEVLGWFGLYCIASAARIAATLQFRRHGPADPVNVVSWEWLHIGVTLLAGIAWGVLFFFSSHGLSAGLTFLVLTLGGCVMIGAIPIIGALPMSYFALCAPLVGGALYLSWNSPYLQREWMLLLIIVLLCSAFAVYRSYLKVLHQNIRYRLLNGRLAAEMMAAHEDPAAGVLRVLKGEVRYANERMAVLTGEPVDKLSRAPLGNVLGPGPWSDPNWISLRQGIEHGVPNTFVWQLPNALSGPQPVQVRVRGVWDFAESHGSVLLFSPLSAPQRYSTLPESETLPVMLATYDDWLKFARREFRKRSSYQSALAVIAASDAGYSGWQTTLAEQLLARMLPREALCIRGHEILLWFSMAARDLSAEQLRVAFRDVLAPYSTGGSSLNAGTVIVDASLEVEEAVRMAELRAQPQD